MESIHSQETNISSRQNAEQPKNKDPKKSLWYWVALLAVVAIIVGGYYFFVYDNFQESEMENQTQNTYEASQSENTVTVNMKDNTFIPAALTIHKGTTVVWKNEDTAKHTVTGDNGQGPHSPDMNRGDSYSDTFIATGSYPYHCSLHPSMKGTVTVIE